MARGQPMIDGETSVAPNLDMSFDDDEYGWDGGGLVSWPYIEQINSGKGQRRQEQKKDVIVVPWENNNAADADDSQAENETEAKGKTLGLFFFCCCGGGGSSCFPFFHTKSARVFLLLSIIAIAVIVVVLMTTVLPDNTNSSSVNEENLLLSTDENGPETIRSGDSNEVEAVTPFPSSVVPLTPAPPPSVSPTSTPTIQISLTISSNQSEESGSPTFVRKSSSSQEPSSFLSTSPSSDPSKIPSATPSISPTFMPSLLPTWIPSTIPSVQPSEIPTNDPSSIPSFSPTTSPTIQLSHSPTVLPETQKPTNFPTTTPSLSPTQIASTSPTTMPSKTFSKTPSKNPSSMPTPKPTKRPSTSPSAMPTTSPTKSPSNNPTPIPSFVPSSIPTQSPTLLPTTDPTYTPSTKPTSPPTKITNSPSNAPSTIPTISPTMSLSPTSSPTTSTTTFFVVSGRLGDISGSEIRENLQSLPTTTSPDSVLIHLGDFLDRDEYPDCSYTPYEKTFNRYLSSPFPVYFVPGDNEWTDCPNPDLAWSYWINTFGQYAETNSNLWSSSLLLPMVVSRQDVRRENFAFSIRSVLHIGLNMIGGSAEVNESDSIQRMNDNIQWIRQSVTEHKNNNQNNQNNLKLVVMYGNANPNQDFLSALGSNDFLGRNDDGNMTPLLSQSTTFVYMHKTSDDWSVSDVNAFGINNFVLVKVKSVWPPMKVEVDLSMSTLNLDQGNWI